MAEFQPYMSEIRFMGGASSDFVEVALDNGVDPATISVVVYHSNGNVRSTNTLDATPDNTIAGTDVYTVEMGVHRNGAVALVQDGVVISFVSFNGSVTANAGPASGMISTQLGTNSQGESFVSTDMGATYDVDTSPDPGVIPCFLSGTLIDTPDGARPIETLRTGDLISTHDGGAKVLSWVGTRRLSAADTMAHGLHPVCIPAGALGAGIPTRDIYISPAHRILVRSAAFELLFEDSEVLVSASHLVGWNGIQIARHISSPAYFHLLFESHQLLRSSGLISESFHPMQQGLGGLTGVVRDELFLLFPQLKYNAPAYGPTTRRCLRRYEVPLAVDSLRRAA